MGWIGSTSDFIEFNSVLEADNYYLDTLENEVPSGLSNSCSICFLGSFESEAEAKSAIKYAWDNNRIRSGLIYARVPKYEDSVSVKKIFQRKLKEEEKLKQYIQENNCYNRKSSTIGCKNCGSSLSTKYMAINHLNRCPLCRAELRNNTVLKTISGYQQNIKKYEKQIVEIEDMHSKSKRNKQKTSGFYFLGSSHFYVG